jgi:serine/threonine-protein kinase
MGGATERSSSCLTDETIAALLEHRLDASAARDVAAHIDRCTECRRIVAEVGHAAGEKAQQSTSRTSEVAHDATSGDRAIRSRSGAEGREVTFADALPAGKTIGRYIVVECIGTGGMGVVYLARDPELGRNLALKLLRADADGPSSARQRARLLREAQAMAQLSHPNVITIFDTGTEGDDVFLAMELVEGGTLADWIRAPGHSWRDVVIMLRRAGEGLAAAHAAGIVHRDFKPDNVLVGNDGRVRVTDFGLARSADDPASRAELANTRPAQLGTSMTQTGAMVGTPAYMAPEQLAGTAADMRSDVFSYCVAFYEALYGVRPFAGSTYAELRQAIARGAIRKPPSGTRVPSWLRRIVLRGLRADAEARPRSVRVVLDAIERRERRASWRLAAGALVAATACAAAALVAFRAMRSHDRKEVAAGPSDAPKPTAITDVPLPPAQDPEALRAYRSGLQKLRDGVAGSGINDLTRATELDPGLAAAHLRLALLTSDQPTKAREHLARAVTTRASLSARDQLLLAAVRTWMQSDPPDVAGFASALGDAQQRYPLDAELAYWAYDAHDPHCGIHGADGDREKMTALSERALALDPGFGLVFVQRLCDAVATNDLEGLPHALRDCEAHAPNATDCLSYRLWIDQAEGNCAELEHPAKELRAREDPGDPTDAPYYLAEQAYAGGRPLETVRELLEQSARSDRYDLVHYGSYLFAPDLLAGDFEAVKRRAIAVEQKHASDPALYWHSLAARRWIFASIESGHVMEAARRAQDFLRHKDAWVTDGGDHVTPWVLSIERQAGLLSAAEFAEQWQRWIAGARQKASTDAERWAVWVEGYAWIAETAEDAARALAEQSTYGPMPRSLFRDGDGDVGKVYFLAGRTAESLPLLRRFARSCQAIRSPGDHTRAHLFLGQALAALGERDEACAAYSVVLSRWGHARPRSVTAEKARSLARTLGCPAAP